MFRRLRCWYRRVLGKEAVIGYYDEHPPMTEAMRDGISVPHGTACDDGPAAPEPPARDVEPGNAMEAMAADAGPVVHDEDERWGDDGS